MDGIEVLEELIKNHVDDFDGRPITLQDIKRLVERLKGQQ